MTASAEQILRARAVALARPIEPESGSGDRYLGFEIAEARFAVELPAIVAVRRPSRPTPLPGAPRSLPGLLAIEATVVPAVRLDLLLGAEADTAGSPPPGWVVVVAAGADRLGLLAHDVVGILPEGEVQEDLPDGLAAPVYHATSGNIGGFLVLSPVGLLGTTRDAVRAPFPPARNLHTTREEDRA